MHHGRFPTLEQVVEHYNSGVQSHPTLSAALKNPDDSPVRLNLNTTLKSTLVAFLKTFTDNTIGTEPKWSNPFCKTNLYFSGSVNSGVFQSANGISNAKIESGNEVSFVSGKSILLMPNFEANVGSSFNAQIGGCN